MLLLWTIALGLIFILWLCKLNQDYVLIAGFTPRIKTTDGTPTELIAPNPKGRTMFANVFDMFQMDMAGFFEANRQVARQVGKSYIMYGLGVAFYNVIDAVEAEMVMNNSSLNTKGIVYNFMEPFVRKGLLTSSDKKWHERRKLLTPAFHFNILEQFQDIFKQESHKFVAHLLSGKDEDAIVSLDEIIPRFTLNSVCETALGVQLDEHLDGDSYRASLKKVEESITLRFSNPFYLSDFIFNLFEGRKYTGHLQAVHDFSSGIIEKRRELLNRDHVTGVDRSYEEDSSEMTKKKRYAMLDTLLRAEQQGLIDHLGICEEVDTFMFEGFDTTSMGLTFALMNLAVHRNMQQKCYEEIEANIEDDLAVLTIGQINKLKYLDCFLRESLRLYPSVPTIMRQATTETALPNKLVLPAGTQISIQLFDILRNPKYFPNPEKFDPDRFLPENSADRHAFSYVPFSAGQRNCIGQKFAMLEMKTLIVYILRHFELWPVMDPKDFVFETGLILRTNTPIKVKVVRRRTPEARRGDNV